MLLNAFPDLLTYSTLAPFILRIIVGVIALDLGYLKIGREYGSWKELFEVIHFRPARFFVWLLALVEIAGGALFILGAYTQIVAIVFSVVFFSESVIEYREESLEKRNIPFYILMLAISLSLVFSGAGAFAFDAAL